MRFQRAGWKPRTKNPAPQVRAPIEDPEIASDVYDRCLKSQYLMLTAQELLSLLPEVCRKICETVTPKRIPAQQRRLATMSAIDNPLPFATDSGSDEPTFDAIDDPLPFAAAVDDYKLVSDATTCSIAVPNSYKIYLKELLAYQQPEILTVAKVSHALRSVNFLIPGSHYGPDRLSRRPRRPGDPDPPDTYNFIDKFHSFIHQIDFATLSLPDYPSLSPSSIFTTAQISSAEENDRCDCDATLRSPTAKASDMRLVALRLWRVDLA
jgi:hypothetical protein